MVLMVTVGSAVSTSRFAVKADAVAHAVGGRRVQGVTGLTGPGWIRCRNGQAPCAVCRRRGRVVLPLRVTATTVPSPVGAGAADAQILTLLYRVQHIIIADGVELTDGRPVSTVTLCVPLPVLPAASVTDNYRDGRGAVAEA